MYTILQRMTAVASQPEVEYWRLYISAYSRKLKLDQYGIGLTHLRGLLNLLI